jgi:hypothetical protein
MTAEFTKHVIQVLWYASSISFIIYYWRSLKAKPSLTDIVILFLGPIGWTSILAVGCFVKIRGKRLDGTMKDRVKAEAVMILSWIPWVILGIWWTRRT